MIDRLRDLYKTIPDRSFAIVLKAKYRDVYNWVLESTDNSFQTFNERVFWLLNPTDLYCDRGNRKKYVQKDKKYGFCGSSAVCECHRLSIITRVSSTTEFNKDGFLEKRKSTWMSAYGVDNPMRTKTISEKVSAANTGKTHPTNKRQNYINEGFIQVTNRLEDIVIPLFDSTEYKGSSREHLYNWQCKKCNSAVVSHIDYGTIPRCTVCFPKTVSTGELQVREFIEQLGFTIITNDKTIIPPLELDIYIPGKNLAIEFNGTYWHSDAKKDKFYHVDKYLQCKKKNIHLIQIFEDEWQTKNSIVKSRLKNILGVDTKVYARTCTIREVDGKISKNFLEEHHSQSWVSSSINLGLYTNTGSLAALMTFGKDRFNGKSSYELLRYCSSGTVVGGAGKLFKYFLRNYYPQSIVSYADRCWSNGNLYRALGFVDVTEDERNTGYFYVKGNQRYHRLSLTKQYLVSQGGDKNLTGDQIAHNMGYNKIFNCGNYKFIFNNPVDKT